MQTFLLTVLSKNLVFRTVNNTKSVYFNHKCCDGDRWFAANAKLGIKADYVKFPWWGKSEKRFSELSKTPLTHVTLIWQSDASATGRVWWCRGPSSISASLRRHIRWQMPGQTKVIMSFICLHLLKTRKHETTTLLAGTSEKWSCTRGETWEHSFSAMIRRLLFSGIWCTMLDIRVKSP